MVFSQNYAVCYDSLYQDKDYSQECDYLERIWRQFGQLPRKILDLGCGTAGHALILAERGYDIVGVDRSAEMLKIASDKTRQKGLNIRYIESDIGQFPVSEKMDSVIAMFAVMGYQAHNEQLARVCKNARAHIQSGGFFLFDCWHGSAVLQLRPQDKVKEISLGKTDRILRQTKSVLDILHQTVQVNFRTQVFKNGRLGNEFSETHAMRYFFPQEITYFLSQAGFSSVTCVPFGEIGSLLTENDWNMMVIAQAN